jgi:hypothetical protein
MQELGQSKRFQQFVKYFKEYQRLFGLTGYQVYFKECDDESNAFADISARYEDGIATIRLYSEKDTQGFSKTVKEHAKHEVLHLLVNHLSTLADKRFATADEIYAAEEELVNRLSCVVRD